MSNWIKNVKFELHVKRKKRRRERESMQKILIFENVLK